MALYSSELLNSEIGTFGSCFFSASLIATTAVHDSDLSDSGKICSTSIGLSRADGAVSIEVIE